MCKSAIRFLLNALFIISCVAVLGVAGLIVGAVLCMAFASLCEKRGQTLPRAQKLPIIPVIAKRTAGMHTVPYWSYSRIRTYKSCPKAFEYQYLNATPPEFEYTPEAWLGKCVHSVAKALLDETVTSRDAAIASYTETWCQPSSWGAGSEGASGAKGRRLFQEGLSMVEELHRWVCANALRTDERLTEVEFDAELPDGKKFMGVLDALFVRDTQIEIIDFKTGVSGRSKPARHGHLKTSHFDGGFSRLGCFLKGAFGHGEPSQNGCTRSDYRVFEVGLVTAAHSACVGDQPGDGGAISWAGGFNPGHCAHRG